MKTELNELLLLIDSVLLEITDGFIVCETCGDQENTKDLDFVDDIETIKHLLNILVERIEMNIKNGL